MNEGTTTTAAADTRKRAPLSPGRPRSPGIAVSWRIPVKALRVAQQAKTGNVAVYLGEMAERGMLLVDDEIRRRAMKATMTSRAVHVRLARDVYAIVKERARGNPGHVLGEMLLAALREDRT